MYETLEPRRLLAGVSLSVLGTYAPASGESSAEISAYDPRTQRLFVVSVSQGTVDILDVSDPARPTLFKTIDVSPLGGPNSVAVNDNVVAVAVGNDNPQEPGVVAFYKTNGQFLSAVRVGALPDMLTFTPDGNSLIVANEGEPSSYGEADSVDPEGSISIINIRGGLGQIKKLTQADVRTAGFSQFNGNLAALKAAGVRIFGPNATVAQDLEPEYVTVSPDSKTAWVEPLGYKNHNLAGNGLDAGERDTSNNIVQRPVLGMYQPDAIANYQAGGQTYLVMANEGDAREYDGFVEALRIGTASNSARLDPVAFPDKAVLESNAGIGRLNITSTLGRHEADADDEFEQLYAFGARSFSIRTASGALVFDSGDDFEQITAAAYPANFNASHDNTTRDNRSDDKGPEPEGLTTGVIDGRTYAFIGLERIGGVMVYDITDPAAPTFVQYINNRNFADPEAPGDLGPEGLLFISAGDSPTGSPLLVVSNEISGTVTLYAINPVAAGARAGSAGVFATRPIPQVGGVKKADESIFGGATAIWQ